MNIPGLAWRSLWHRRATAGLVVLSIALSVVLLLGVERLRAQARSSFAGTLSGTDLIVGARGSPVNLLLYSVFRIGDATNGVSWSSHLALRERPEVTWTVPLSLGDSHRGFPVLGTDRGYFEHYRHAGGRRLEFADGGVFDDRFDAVLGAEVARRLGYRIGDRLTLAHGAGRVSFMRHADKPFVVRGILAPTATPVDRTVHVSLAGLDAVHEGWPAGHAARRGHESHHHESHRHEATHEAVTAILVGLRRPGQVLHLQRAINEFEHEPLLAILPALTLQQLWDLLAVGEHLLLGVAALVVVCGGLATMTALLTGLNERRREMAILRALGASPRAIFGLVLGEALLLTVGGMLLGALLLQLLLLGGLPLLADRVGLAIPAWPPSPREAWLLGGVCCAGLCAGLVPALRVYRQSLADGMTIRL